MLAGLEAADFDTQTWDLVVGTSAGAYVGARLTGDGSSGPLFAVQTSGNDAYEDAELRVMFGLGFGFVRTVRPSRRPLLRSGCEASGSRNFVVTTLMRYAIRHGWRSTVSLVNTLGPGRAKADPHDVLAKVGAVANLSRKSTVLIGNWEHALGAGRAWPATSLDREVADLRRRHLACTWPWPSADRAVSSRAAVPAGRPCRGSASAPQTAESSPGASRLVAGAVFFAALVVYVIVRQGILRLRQETRAFSWRRSDAARAVKP